MIKAIVLDVDGTLTDGKLYVSNSGDKMKAFNVKDGMAIKGAMEFGIDIFIITGKTSEIVEARGKELKLREVFQGIENKVEKLKEICAKYDFLPEELAYMGDDLNDLGAIKFCGLSGSPADGGIDVLEKVDFISKKNGGDGAVREFVELIMRKQNLWTRYVEKFENMN